MTIIHKQIVVYMGIPNSIVLNVRAKLKSMCSLHDPTTKHIGRPRLLKTWAPFVRAAFRCRRISPHMIHQCFCHPARFKCIGFAWALGLVFTPCLENVPPHLTYPGFFFLQSNIKLVKFWMTLIKFLDPISMLGLKKIGIIIVLTFTSLTYVNDIEFIVLWLHVKF